MAEDTLKVKAGKNGPVHRPELARAVRRDALITHEVVEVPNTRYYRQRIAKGDLERVEDVGVPDSVTMVPGARAPKGKE